MKFRFFGFKSLLQGSSKITNFRPYCKPSNTTLLGLNSFRVSLHRQNKMNAKKNYYPSTDGCYFTIGGMILNHCVLDSKTHPE